jgi:hypothetical protein
MQTSASLSARRGSFDFYQAEGYTESRLSLSGRDHSLLDDCAPASGYDFCNVTVQFGVFRRTGR